MVYSGAVNPAALVAVKTTLGVGVFQPVPSGAVCFNVQVATAVAAVDVSVEHWTRTGSSGSSDHSMWTASPFGSVALMVTTDDLISPAYVRPSPGVWLHTGAFGGGGGGGGVGTG